LLLKLPNFYNSCPARTSYAAFFDSIGGGKLSQIVVGQRLTFSIAFDFANQYLVGRTVILGKQYSILYLLLAPNMTLATFIEQCNISKSLSEYFLFHY
jgi:hypothetical protein